MKYLTIDERWKAHDAVLRKHGFKRKGVTAHGSYRYVHKCGARAYYSFCKPKNGWRTRLTFRGLWGWTGRFYANHQNLDRFLTLYK